MTSADREATRTLGRYILCDEIAAGGMATVHIGRLLGPVGFARTVAIKRLHPQFAKDPEFVAMFLDEARIAARIRHPNVASTLDVVVLKGELFVVMEYVHGEPLSRLIRASRDRTGRGVPLPIALTIVANALNGLHAAHEATNDYGAPLGIVHRDVSPQNILVGQDGVARVVDFGVAKATDRLQTTREGALKGKISYMSPEQVAAEPIDRRTDIYAASVVLWEMLTAQRLFVADSEVGILRAVLGGAIRPPSATAPGIPPAVDALVARGLARDPANRFSTAAEMAEAAQQIAYATPGQIGAWVKQLGGGILEQRAARVARIESNPARAGEALDDSPPESATQVRIALSETPPPVPQGTPVYERIRAEREPASQVSAFNVTTPVRSRRVSLVLAIALPAFALVGIGAIVGVRAMRPSSIDVAPLASSAADDRASAEPPAPASTEASPSASTGVEPPPPPSASARGTPSASTVPRSPAKRPAARGRPGCNPPYTVDERGIRVPKMECL